MRKTKAFTLIELLVVIAIIGILAAMVFPVFARARESARKAVCLSNVKNIALAVQMYLADNNDTLPPGEHRTDVLDWFEVLNGGDPWCVPRANPYLRWPVVLDEYVKNRDVWRCPSAKMTGGATFMVPDQDWFAYFVAHDGEFGPGADYWGVCHYTWPTGWGGSVTDSIVQGGFATAWSDPNEIGAGADKAFEQSVGLPEVYDLKLVSVQDPVKYVICGDGGATVNGLTLATLAFPDICCMGCTGACAGGDLDWETCPDTSASWYEAACSECIPLHADLNLRRDPSYRISYTRHLGGVNTGYLDGHASWVNSERLVAAYADGDVLGLDFLGPSQASLQSEGCWVDPSVPTLF